MRRVLVIKITYTGEVEIRTSSCRRHARRSEWTVVIWDVTPV